MAEMGGGPPATAPRRPGALVELILLAFCFLLFTRLAAAAGRDLEAADAHALALQSVDRAAQHSWRHPSHHTAMPSMRVGWSLWCAYAVWSARRLVARQHAASR